jgi:hypothetical protein
VEIHTPVCSTYTLIVFVGLDFESYDHTNLTKNRVTLGGLVVSVLATGPKIRGFKSGQGRWIIRAVLGGTGARFKYRSI